jgi:DNA-binding SARP family transcriptional activator
MKQRAVFALLAMSAGRVVSMDRLIDEIWHQMPPAQATVTLRAYISRLRRVLEAAPSSSGDAVPQILTQPPGWILTLPRDDVDVFEFETLLEGARDLIDPEDGVATADSLQQAGARLLLALDLCRGEMLADLHGLDVAASDIARMHELRLFAVELLLQTRLQLGQDERVVQEATSFVHEYPFRERAWELLVLALYRLDRQSDATGALARLRGLLLDELGLDLSPTLQDLETRILRQDPSLRTIASHHAMARTAPPRPPEPTRLTRSADGGPNDSSPATSPVGRTATTALLRRAVEGALAGRGSVVVLEGSPDRASPRCSPSWRGCSRTLVGGSCRARAAVLARCRRCGPG